jgi:hypothetical protein
MPGWTDFLAATGLRSNPQMNVVSALNQKATQVKPKIPILQSGSAGLAWQIHLRPYLVVLAVYVLATWLTGTHFIGDTPEYVESILAHSKHVYVNFWDFGHLLWRPLGWLGFVVFRPVTSRLCGLDDACNATVVLLSVNWLAGLGSALLMCAFVRRICHREWAAVLTAVALIVSGAFLNFVHTGVSYVPGLCLLLLGLTLATSAEVEGKNRALRDWLAGAALVGSVCLWFLYILAIPAALASPIILFGDSPSRRRTIFRTAVAFAVVAGLVYASVLATLGIFSWPALKMWIASSSHGKTQMEGPGRAVFGFARSWIDMGNDGVLFKRFLLHDPLNPVTGIELLWMSLGKLILFYALLGSLGVSLLFSREGRRILAFLILSGLPLMCFAVLWRGADIERYLPLYPAFFLTIGWSLSRGWSAPWRTAATVFFIGVLAVTNANALSKRTLRRHYAESASRMASLEPLLTSKSQIVLLDGDDEIMRFSRNFPLDPINRTGKFNLYLVVRPNTAQVVNWRERFAAMVWLTWQRPGDVWISKRLLREKPKPEWNWVEGDDARLSWMDIHGLFSKLETTAGPGGDDDFTLLSKSANNQALLKSLVSPNDLGVGSSYGVP